MVYISWEMEIMIMTKTALKPEHQRRCDQSQQESNKTTAHSQVKTFEIVDGHVNDDHSDNDDDYYTIIIFACSFTKDCVGRDLGLFSPCEKKLPPQIGHLRFL